MKILVIGDSCTDIFRYGKVERIAPEAPVPIIVPEKETSNPGMAGNVVANLKALGAEIYKHDPKIDEQQPNDIVQRYLNRVLFLRVCDDRNLEDYQHLLNFANTNDLQSLIKKLKAADKRYNYYYFYQFQ